MAVLDWYDDEDWNISLVNGPFVDGTDVADADLVIGPSWDYPWRMDVVNPGDVDGDGRADLALWDESADDGGAHLWVVSPASRPRVVDDALYRVDVSIDEDAEGVVGAGDLDGDGRAEVLVQAPWAEHGGEGVGGVWIFSGVSAGMNQLEDAWRLVRGPGFGFGSAIATGVDVDGDTVPDVAVSSDDGVRVFSGADFR